MKKHYVLIFFMLIGVLTKAQENNYNILFSSKDVLLQESLNQTVFTNQEKSINGNYYRIIQFYATLLPKDYEKLQNLGIELKEYIPHNAYIASFPENFSVAALPSGLVRTIAPLQAEWKLASNLYKGDIPKWANHGNGQMDAVAIPYSGIPMTQFVADLQRSGVRVKVIQENETTVDIQLAINDIEKLATLASLKHLHAGEEPGQPENDGARRSARVSLVNTRYGIADRYDGTGVLISLGDDGDIGPHIDYQGRLVSVAGVSNGDHGDHVAGTIFGAGNRDPRGLGMAPGVDIRYYSYPGNLNNADNDYSDFNVRITSSSYSNGCNAGYTSFARNLDLGTYTNEKLLHVFSAGNSGSSNCNYGAGSGWGNITGGHKIGKNVIAVANIQKNDLIAASSSRGPAHDGRIKPEIGAVGTSVFSTTDPHIYTTKTGTSMSCPGVSGSLSLIYQAYKEMHSGVDPDAGLAKAILLNTADDLGNPGPDFTFGFGKMHVARALDAVEDSTFIIDQIATGQIKTHTISVPANTAQARVMLYWTDPPASVNSSRALVNDLNLTVTSNNVPYQPWVLDPTPVAANLNSLAVRATDTLNNVEQVTLDNPTAGDLTISVTGNVNLGGNQKFYLVYTFIREEIKVVFPAGGESLVPNETSEVRWDANEGVGSFQVQYSVNNGQTWTTIGTAAANARRIGWSIPNIPTGQGLVRVTRGSETAVSDFNFSIALQPTNLTLNYACPDSIGISWSPVQGADSYQIYVLGNKYMDSVDVTTATNYVFFNQNPANEMWISVAALGPNNLHGRRAIAINKPSGLFNCIIQKDLAITALVSPSSGMTPDCQVLANANLSINLENVGIDTIMSSPVSYQINNGSLVWDTVFTPLVPGASLQFTFSAPLVFGSGSSTVKIFSGLLDDGNRFNDTLETNFEVYPSTTISTFPYSQNFQSMSNCQNTNSCGGNTCALSLGWVNEINGTHDNIDWLVNNGTTASSGTGPGQAFNPANSSGKYIHLEATGCFEQEARVLTPCFDLSNATVPEASFYYHMLGTDMGSLHVDVLVDGAFDLDVITPISGNKGAVWREQKIDLTTYAGKVVTIRFRGITGPDFRSDMAIDAFSVYEVTTPPVASFNVTPSTACLQTPITLENTSSNGALSFQWFISPSTFSMLNGTTLTDRNPVIACNALGNYDITLVAFNPNGTDTVVDSAAVNINQGLSLPIVEDFSSTVFPPVGWEIENPDAADTWVRSGSITGASGTATNAAFINNFNYNAAGQADYLNLPILDLTTAAAPFLTFEVAYARFNGTLFDSLEIEVSTDCGLSFNQTIYSKGGTSLATRADQGTSFTPSDASHWRTDSIDLSSFNGNPLRVRFKAINGYGNNLFINNVNLIDTAISAPSLTLSASTAQTCPGDSVTFSAQVTGSVSVYNWNFGPLAIPSTATGPGPVVVSYIAGGTYTAELSVSNSGGTATDQIAVVVDPNPIANFFFVNNQGLEYQFSDNSQNNPTAWLWDFNDGNTSTLQNPIHTFAPGQLYQVSLTVTNDCGQNTRIREIDLVSFNTADWQVTGMENLTVRPNPSTGLFLLSGISSNKADVIIRVTDLVGRTVFQEVTQFNNSQQDYELQLNYLAKGTYMLHVDSGSESRSVKLIVN